MKLLVLGATGGIGRAVVDQLLERGHRVTAFVRSPEKVVLRHERLNVVGGAPQDPDALARTLAAHDAMVSALGPRSRKDDQLLPECTQSMIEAMHRTGVRRLLTVSTGLLFPNVGLLGLVFRMLLHRTLRGAAQAERLLQESDLDWTVVRAVRLTDGPRTRHCRTFTERLPPGPKAIARADVADMLVEALENGAHLRTIVGVCQ